MFFNSKRKLATVEDRYDCIPAYSFVVAITSRAHLELVDHGLVLGLELLTAMIYLVEILECRMEKLNIESTVFGMTSVTKWEFVLLSRDLGGLRCG